RFVDQRLPLRVERCDRSACEEEGGAFLCWVIPWRLRLVIAARVQDGYVDAAVLEDLLVELLAEGGGSSIGQLRREQPDRPCCACRRALLRSGLEVGVPPLVLENEVVLR